MQLAEFTANFGSLKSVYVFSLVKLYHQLRNS